MSKHKLEICEYFDRLINRLDFIVETALAENFWDEELKSGLNSQREAFLAEIRQVEAFNLSALNSNKEPANTGDLFPIFCFFIQIQPGKNRKTLTFNYNKLVETEIALKLIVTDKYLTDEQIKCYENLFNFKHLQGFLDYELIFSKNTKFVED
jgi:hypothetical protein